jgi:hypothetical protein
MSAWSAVLALSGFSYDGGSKSVVAVPLVAKDNFHCFWSTGTGWGTFSCKWARDGRSQFRLRVLAGQLTCRSFEIYGVGTSSSTQRNGKEQAHTVERREGRTIFHLNEAVTVVKDEDLLLEVRA